MNSIEICAGAGGQAIGLEQAGFNHIALVEIDSDACATLHENKPEWNVICGDVREFSARKFEGIDLLAGGVPCPPFSVAGKQLGHNDERNLFPEVIRLAHECKPKAIMIENVKGLLSAKFDDYRREITYELEMMGYFCQWKLFNASDFGVPQFRSRTVLVAFKEGYQEYFSWPPEEKFPASTVGQTLINEMSLNGWRHAQVWANKAAGIAPTLVGGSKKHGGPDLGPTRSKIAWEKLGVDGSGIAKEPPEREFEGEPKLTVRMAALLQGFPSEWKFTGKKTSAYRQVGNAFPPPVAKAIGFAIYKTIYQYEQSEVGGLIYAG